MKTKKDNRRRTTKNKKLTCKKGEIMVDSYKTKKGTVVKKHCKKDLGKPGKGKKIFTIKKGGLSKYGYSMKNNDTERKKALNKASKHIPKNTLIRKLNALYILHRNTNPTFSNRARKDMKYIQNKYKS